MDERELRRRLLSHVVRHLSGDAIREAAYAIRELLTDAHDEMAEELLAPIFAWSEFWPEEVAKATLGSDSDDEIGCSELLARFEEREQGPPETPLDWTKEGF